MADPIPVLAIDSFEWHERRRGGLGGSDAAVVLGWSPWKTPWHLYLEKVGEVVEEPGDSEAQYWGRALEDIIADEYADRTGQEVWAPARTFRHPDHDWMFASPDRLIVGGHDGPGLLEVKNVTAWKAGEWHDGPPKHYLVQWQHTAAVMGCTWGAFAALVGGNRLVIVDMERDDELVALLVEREAEFWGRVQRREPPPIDGAASTEELLKRLYAEADPGSEMVVGDVVVDALIDWHRADERLKAAEEEKRRATNAIRAAIQEAEAAVTEHGAPVATWKQQTRTRLDTDRLKAEDPELYEKYARTDVIRVLRPNRKSAAVARRLAEEDSDGNEH